MDSSRTKRNIVLVGFMGTGKSTVGRKLAKSLGWTFVDTDAVIEQRERTTIAELFRTRGEAYFRSAEAEAIREIMSGESQVVATGGGAVLHPMNREHMLEGGFVVALTGAVETIVARVKGNPDRPLLQGDAEARVRELMEARKSAYDFAHAVIATDSLYPEEVADNILSLYQKG